jgi:hypothetical protein
MRMWKQTRPEMLYWILSFLCRLTDYPPARDLLSTPAALKAIVSFTESSRERRVRRRAIQLLALLAAAPMPRLTHAGHEALAREMALGNASSISLPPPPSPMPMRRVLFDHGVLHVFIAHREDKDEESRSWALAGALDILQNTTIEYWDADLSKWLLRTARFHATASTRELATAIVVRLSHGLATAARAADASSPSGTASEAQKSSALPALYGDA